MIHPLCVYSVATIKEKVVLYGGTKNIYINVKSRFRAIDEALSHFWEKIIKYILVYAKLKEIVQEEILLTLALPSRRYDRLLQCK